MTRPLDDPKTGVDLTVSRALRRLSYAERWDMHERVFRKPAGDKPNVLDLLIALASAEPMVVLVGDFAVALHGGKPHTLLLEVVLPPFWSSAPLFEVLQRFHATHREDGEALQELVVRGGALRLMTDAGPLDLISYGVTTRSKVKACEDDTIMIGDRPIHVASKAQLLTMLRAGGWSKDAPLISELEVMIAREVSG